MTNFRLYNDSDGNKPCSRTNTINLIDSDVVGLLQSIYEINVNPDYFEESEFENIERIDDKLAFTYKPTDLQDTIIHFNCYFDYLMSEWRYRLKTYYKDSLEYDCDREANDRIVSWVVMINHDLRKRNQLTLANDNYSFIARASGQSIAEPAFIEFKDKKDESLIVYIGIDNLKYVDNPINIVLYKDSLLKFKAKPNIELQTEIFNWANTRNKQYHLPNKRLAELIVDQTLYRKTYYDNLEYLDRGMARTAKDVE